MRADKRSTPSWLLPPPVRRFRGLLREIEGLTRDTHQQVIDTRRQLVEALGALSTHVDPPRIAGRSRDTDLTPDEIADLTPEEVREIYEHLTPEELRYADLTPEDNAFFERVRPYTLTSRERIATLADAVRYVVRTNIAGDFVECGVWRGGSAMAIAITLAELGERQRGLWLYDTFTQIPPAEEWDRDYAGRSMMGVSWWPSAPVEEVVAAMRSTGYPEEQIHYVQGLVEETIPSSAPDRIALLRLDTDWYASTRHELEHLYPRLAPGGVLIVDDYGHFAGQRKATDEYLADKPILLTRVDYTCRMGVKMPAISDP